MAPAKKAAKKATKKATKKSPAKKTAKRATKKSATKRTAKKATKKATSRRSSGSAASVVVASKLRETVRGHNVRMSADLVDAVNDEVHDLLTKAVKRARDNGRSTVRPSDL